MIEQVLIRGVVMGKNAAGQKLVQPLMNNADGLRIWTDDKCLIRMVYCGNCKYLHKTYDPKKGYHFNCKRVYGMPKVCLNDYCSRGERNE